MPPLMPYTPAEIVAYRQSFRRRMAQEDPSAYWEYELWEKAVVTWYPPIS